MAGSLAQAIFAFRNEPKVEELRRAIRIELYPEVKAAEAKKQDKTGVVKTWLNSEKDREKDVKNFLSRMNTLAWQILLLPSKPVVKQKPFGQRQPDQNAILEIIHGNLIVEWDALEPWIASQRESVGN